MALDPRYVWLPTLQQLFVDKNTNEFLANGYILFFDDNQRTVGKEVFTISGSPPAYSFVPYGFFDINGAWRVNLDQDSAIDVALYFYPYDAMGNVDNYFIQVYNSAGVPQFSLEAIPNIPTGGNTGTVINENFVPNPQFLLHYMPNATPTNKQGQIVNAETAIAYGGWYFERPIGSTATDTVTFNRIGSPITNPIANPRYEVVVTCITPGGDAYKYLHLESVEINIYMHLHPELCKLLQLHNEDSLWD